ncbi:probable disease resistance protein At5g66900 isoform X2 [Diospyros lotus]|uniref:probable disease resistance protein At5g66900 isoform X2 n=1 Tax=Diospyros lotus TaxID=55363 RepID=UPI00224CA5DA|nr:probable disease resistance protein At5g66900 isoform X2 [Diospyros lotus]
MDAAIGVAFQELFTAVMYVGRRAAKFKSILKKIESTLNRVTPMIEENENLGRNLDISQGETEMFISRFTEARKVVLKCRKIYAPVDTWRNSRRSLAMLNEINSRMGRTGTMGGMGEASGFLRRCGVPKAPDFVVGFKEPLQMLKARLLKDKEQLVVLSAPGGWGKTTLAKLLCHDHESKEKFKSNIFFFTFSNEPNLEVIVGKLFQRRGYTVAESDFPTEEDAFNQLERMLKETGSDPILLVLDDVWSGSEDHIMRFKFRIPNSQILVTSRLVFPEFSTSTYRLESLKDKDAWDLFHHWAFPNGNSSIPDYVVNKIVRGCGGLPLFLEVFGRSLCEQPVVIWNRTLKQWSEEKPALHPNEKLLKRLITSF